MEGLESLFERALRLDPPWRITRIEFRETVYGEEKALQKIKKYRNPPPNFCSFIVIMML